MKIRFPRIDSKARLVVLAGLAAGLAVLLIANRFAGSASDSELPSQPAVTATGAGSTAPAGASAAPSPTTKPTAATTDDGDDGAEGTPILVEPTKKADVQEAGTQFAAAWLNTFGQSPENWRAGITSRATPDLAADLADADPASVPAGGRVAGTVGVTAEGSLYNVAAPVVTADNKKQPLGTLTLTMVNAGGKWLVSEIDWKAAG